MGVFIILNQFIMYEMYLIYMSPEYVLVVFMLSALEQFRLNKTLYNILLLLYYYYINCKWFKERRDKSR